MWKHFAKVYESQEQLDVVTADGHVHEIVPVLKL